MLVSLSGGFETVGIREADTAFQLRVSTLDHNWGVVTNPRGVTRTGQMPARLRMFSSRNLVSAYCECLCFALPYHLFFLF